MRIRKGDTVYVLTGEDRGKTGRVLQIDYKKQQVVVEGRAMRKKHQRPSQKNPQGGIVTIEGPIHLSNVALYSSSLAGPTKVAYKTLADGDKKRRVRISAKSGEEI